MKMTKQGVRDLGFTKVKKMLSEPPPIVFCKHKKVVESIKVCPDCGQKFDKNGRVIFE